MDSATIESVHARVGTTVRDKWVLGPVLGAGGTAAVYEGTHRTNGKKVAVKVMHSFLASSEDVVARFQREGYIANKVGHPGAVTILDDDTTEDGSPFLVMDRLEGEPLARILDHAYDGLPLGQVLSITHEVLDILAAAHARGIVHRDIKPDNVFLTTAGRIMILDFGIARLRERVSELPGGADLSTRTQDGSALGTPQYMAPEQARGRWSEVDAQSDVWAVGALMFRLVTGKPVRDQRGAAEMLLSAMTERAPSVLSVAPGVPPDVAATIDKALEFDKQDRWPDARAMQTAVRETAQRLGTPDAASLAATLIPSTPPPPAPAEKRRSPALAILVGATLVLGAVALLLKPLEAALRPGATEPLPVATVPTTAGPATEPAAAPTIEVDPSDLPEATPQPHTYPFHRHHAHAAPSAPPAPHPAESSSASPASILDRRH